MFTRMFSLAFNNEFANEQQKPYNEDLNHITHAFYSNTPSLQVPTQLFHRSSRCGISSPIGGLPGVCSGIRGEAKLYLKCLSHVFTVSYFTQWCVHFQFGVFVSLAHSHISWELNII